MKPNRKNVSGYLTFVRSPVGRESVAISLLRKILCCATNAQLSHTTCGREFDLSRDQTRSKARCG